MTRARNISRILSAQEISGDINLSGIVTATEFYGSGSNLTGVGFTADTSTNSLVVTGISTLGNVTAGVATANQFSGNITGTAATFSGNVTIGGVLTYDDVTNVDSLGIITARSGVSIADSIFHTGDTNTAIRFPAADTFTVETGGSEALRVNSNQSLLVGLTTSILIDGVVNSKSQIEHTNYDASLTIKRNQNSSGGPTSFFVKSRGTFLGSNTVVQSGDTLGRLRFFGTDGSDPAEGASISAVVDGTPGSNDMPGSLRFNTTADGAASPTERLRINSSGDVIVNGTATGSSAKFEVQNTTGAIDSATARIDGGKTTTGAVDTGSSLLFAGHDGSSGRDFASLFAGKENGTSGNRAAYLAVGTRVAGGNLTEKLRITSTGGVHFNNAELIERVNITSGKLSDNTTINLDNGMVHYFTTTETTTAIPNITTTAGINTNMATGDTMSVTIITTAATAGFSTGARIDAGSTLSVLWNGGTDPSEGGDGGVDAYTYQIIKTGDAAFTILGNVSNFA